MMAPEMKKRSGECGSALIAVLFLVFSGSIIAMSVLALSKSGTFQLSAHVERQRSMLVAEGVATRIKWLLAADNHLFPNEAAGETDYSVYEEHDRFLSDGVKHVIDYYGERVQVTVTDTISGHDIINNRSKVLSFFTSDEDIDEEEKEDVTLLQTKINDYIDSNDDAGEDSWEKAEYEDLGMAPLPRNATPEFREELLLIPEFARRFPMDKNGRLTGIRLIPPAGAPDLSGAPSLFTATGEMIKYYCNIEEDKLPEVMQALEEWRNNRVLLSDSLDEELLNQLKSGLAMNESGIYTVTIEAPDDEPRPFARLTFSYDGEMVPIGGPENGIVEYLEWNYY